MVPLLSMFKGQERTVGWNRSSITMFTLHESGMLLPGLRHASPRWLNLLARVIGRYGFEKRCGQPAEV